ncbi:MAG: nitrous oxide reductase accessory protein NosL [Balneolaceae bacterium]
MKTLWLVIVGIYLVFTSCQKGPKEIMYGQENCTYCSMTIMDDKHAAQIVTNTGKVYVFDSIECMLRSLEVHADKAEQILVMDFNNPGTFLSASEASYLIAPQLPSPMGANLTAFSSDEEASDIGYEGTLYNWDSIREQIH